MGLFLYKYRKEFHGLILLLIGLFITTSFILTTRAGTGGYQATDVLGQLTSTLNNFPYTSQFDTSVPGAFNYPAAIAKDSSGNSYVADTINNRIVKFDSSDAYLIEFGSGGTGDGEFDTPSGIAIDPDDNVYVADTGNNRIEKFDSNGAFIDVRGFGVTDSTNVYQICTTSCHAGLAGSGDGQLDFPLGLVFSPAGFMYVADALNNRIEVFDADGVFVSKFGTPPGGSADGEFDYPSDVAIDSSNNIYVTDYSNNRVEKFDSFGVYVGQFGVSGSDTGEFDSPSGIAVDSSNNIYVVDTNNNRVEKFSQTPVHEFSLPALFSQNTALSNGGSVNAVGFATQGADYGATALDAVGHRLFVTDPVLHRVLVFNLDTDNLIPNTLDGHTADIVLGQSTMFITNYGAAAERFNTPVGLAFDAVHNRLFVADQSNDRVLVFDASNLSNGVPATNVLGEPDFTSVNNTNVVSASLLGNVGQIAYDDIHDRLFVTDFRGPSGGGAARILVFNTNPGTLGVQGDSAVDVIGAPDFTSGTQDLTATSLKRFAYPTGVTYDPDGDRLFVSDNSLGNNGAGTRILMFDTSTLTYNGTPSDPSAVATIDSGDDDFTSLLYSTNLSGQPNDRLFAFESNSNRVLVFDALSLSSTPVAALGQPDFTDTTTGTDQSMLSAPLGGSMDPESGRLYILDKGNNRVMLFDVPYVSTGLINGSMVGSSFSQQLSANNIQGTEAFEVAPGSSLPPGLSISSSGLISGTPTAAGDYDVFFRAIDVFGTDNFAFLSPWKSYTFTVTGDVTPPEISNIVASPTSTTVTITWDTNEDASSFVDYGLSVSYTTTTTEIDTSPGVMHHSVTIMGLTPATVYHYRVNSKDTSFNSKSSFPDLTFTTTNPPDTTAPTISSITSSKTNGIYTVGEVIAIQVTFSENVTSTGSVTVTLETGATDRTCTFTISNNSSGSCNYIVQAGDTSADLDTASISGTIKDQALNPMTNFTPATSLATNKNIVIDTTPPTVSLTAPTNSATVSGTIALSATASDNVAVAQVKFYYGTTLIGTDTTGTPDYGISWNTNALINGSYVLKAKAYDTAGNTTDSATITITIANTGFYDASDLLGQFDATHISGINYTYSSTPNFTTSNINSNGDGTPAVNSIGMNMPEGTGIDTVNHHLFVSDYGNSRVLVFDLDSSNQLIDNQADYVLGQSDMSSFTAGSGVDELNFPIGLAVDSTHSRLYVSDYGNSRVVVFDISSSGQTICGVTSSGLATGMDASCALGLSGSPTPQNSFAPDGGIAIDETNETLYVTADFYRVLIFDVGSASRTLCGVPTNGLASGMDASCVLGETNFGVADPASTAGSLNNPIGIAIDSAHHRLYVADQWDARVSIFDTTTLASGEDAVHVLGVGDFNGTPTAQDGTLTNPVSVTLDLVHDLVYVADNSRILVFDSDPATFTDGESARAILGQPNFVSSFSGTTINEMSFIGVLDQLAFDGDNNRLYVADDANNRILIYYFITLPDAVIEASSPTTGNAYSGSVAVSNSQGAVTYQLVSGSLPAGLSLDTSTGDITGTPTVLGTSNFTIKATDTVSLSSFFDEKSYSMTVSTSATCDDTTATNFGGALPCRYSSGGGSYPQCSDSRDNDSDGFVDFPADPQCSSLADNSESDAVALICPNIPSWSGSVPPPHTYKNGYGQCVNYQCADGNDNDGDGLIDLADAGCSSLDDNSESNIVSFPVCSDNLDNDGDGLVDYPNDPGCSSVFDSSEYNAPLDTCATDPSLCVGGNHECSDGLDNDGDGLTDYSADPGCSSLTDDSEYNVVVPPPLTYQCSDGLDNDGDGLTDYSADPGCSNASDNSEVNPLPDYCSTHPSDPTCNVVLGDFIGNIGNIIHTPYGDPISKAIAITGLLIGTIASLAALFFSTPFTIAELFLLPMRLWSLLLVAFGLKKRVRPWGTVYDAVTKQPLDPVYLELIDKDSKQVATAITDLDGRYGFLVPPGYYMLRPKKTNYIFPSVLLGHVTRDEVYLDLYFGNYFEIKKDNEVITKNIPMDPEGFDWNEFAKHEQKLMKFYSKRTLWLTKISDIAFSIGFLVSLIAFLSNPVLYNILIFSLYILLLVLKEAGVSLGKLGTIVDKKTGKPLSYAIMHVYSAALGNEVIKKISTEYGQFYLLIPNGVYHVSIEKKNADGTYNEVYRTTKPIQVKKGIIKGMWEV